METEGEYFIKHWPSSIGWLALNAPLEVLHCIDILSTDYQWIARQYDLLKTEYNLGLKYYSPN